MRTRAAALAALLTVSSGLTAVPAGAQSSEATAAPPPVVPVQEAPALFSRTDDGSVIDPRLLAVGAGAIVGVVAFNVLTVPLGTVPLAGGMLAAVPGEIALGSRLIAAASGAAGALLATEAYTRWTDQTYDLSYVAALAAGALGGVAVGNILAGTLGYLPYYPGAAGSVAATTAGYASSAAQAASRIHVIASGVLGAWAADYLYGLPKD